MTETVRMAIAGTEHWTRKGDVRLFLWQKPPPPDRTSWS